MSPTVVLARTVSTGRIVSIVFLGCFLLAATAEPQATIKSLAHDLEPLTETTDIRLTRFADFTDEPAVRVGMTLEPGDLLTSGPGGFALELECAGGSLLRFTESFRVLVDVPGEGVDCAVNFLSGTVDVLTDQPTEIEAGGVVLGSEGTQYSVHLVRRSNQPDFECLVYDGRVEWRLPKQKLQPRQKTKWLRAGKSMRMVNQKTAVTLIAPRQFATTAQRYARFDVVNAKATGLAISNETTATNNLARVHQMVLAQPKDTQLRVDLAKAQLQYALPAAANYNLRVGGVRTQEQMQVYQIDSRQLQSSPLIVTDLPPALIVPIPWTLVQQKKYKEAIEAGELKVKAGSVSSRDYYALALAYRELEGKSSRKAPGYAKRATSLHARDQLLTDDELRHCASLGQGR